MQKRSRLLALVLVLSLAAIGPALARPPTDSGAEGAFNLSVHAHSSEFAGPGGAGTLVETTPLAFPPEGEFSYSSIPCRFPAPFNDRALRFTPNPYPIPQPAPVRHIVEGTVTDGIVEGTITTILCVDGQESESRIVTAFEGELGRVTENQAPLTGTFEIIDATGIFEGLEGSGKIRGAFTCFPPILEREGAESCEDLGVFSDFAADLHGHFEDPAV
ncbi:MAG: hypothetical protein M3252_02085 [Actinomycetota bacterium]|nr:hypothetical protein [Actinomycetota bacterium]